MEPRPLGLLILLRHLGRSQGTSRCDSTLMQLMQAVPVYAPEFKHYLNGVELVDSISTKFYKWFLTNLGCCYLWIMEPRLLTDSLSFNPKILRNNASETKTVIDHKDLQIALSRRFRAMKLWIVIQRYGFYNVMFHIRNDMNLVKRFEARLGKDHRFKIL